ncbi:MAG: DUF3500 domain-containing protein [Vicinamibacterales bacterium]
MKSRIVARMLLVPMIGVAWVTGVTIASERAASSMAKAASQFLASLTPEQRQQATFAIDSEELTRWHYVPAQQFPRNGLAIRAMNETQRGLAHELMKTGLSQRGYTQATTIMVDLENILKALENGSAMRDPEQYCFSIFGTPGTKGVWGWRVNGHHLSLHFNVANGSMVASAPTFFGSNPAEVRVEGPKKGLRVLGDREDSARALLLALDDKQRPTAMLEGVAPGDIVTKTAVKVDPLSPTGIAASAMNPKQRELLMTVVESYTSSMTADIASERLAQLKSAGLDKITFAWAGESEVGKKHYYRVQGPTFLIEYDNTQNDGNHVHSVWRDFNGDFGRDLLREHVQDVKHE